ncbi:hypothetical protein, partial [Roseovarius sp.]|uniref:hypothetical protein n=1 Tax=Roseovarius sp. TaxID=1486281 RepID=UPI00356268BF
MGRLIRYENGIYGVPERGGLSWLLQDRVLEANPEIHEAIDISNLFKGSPVVAQARHMVVFMALQAGHIDAMRRFLAEIDDETVTTMSAATVLSTQLEARRDDPRMDVERIAAITILAFNDYLAGKHRRAYLWEPGDDDITGDIDPEDLAPDMVTSVPKVRRYDRARIDRYHDWNLNVPRMSGYPGLRDAKIQTSDTADTFTGKTARDLQRAAAEPADNVYAKVTTVTPEDAQGFLDRFNKENRKIQDTHVRTIARDIEAGNWAFNAQPICFTANPFADDAAYPTVRLLNGQHRLEACVRADTPIQVPIAVGIDARAFATYDTQAKKSVKTGNAKGVDERVLNSAGIIQWRIDTGLRFNDRARPSSTELIETVERHTGMAQHISLARRLKPFGSAGILTFFIYHIRTDKPALAEDFLHQLETGEE